MPVHAITHSALGLLNNSFPLWDLGARFFWSSRNGNKLQRCRGEFVSNVTDQEGVFALAPTTYSATSEEIFYDPGKAAYVQLAGAPTLARVPRSGDFVTGGTNRWGQTNQFANQRGFTAEAGLTVSLPAGGDNREILQMLDGGPFDFVLLDNTSGSTKRFFRTQTQSVSGIMTFGILARRADRGVIDANTLEMIVENNVNADVTTIPTVYRRINDKGWYYCTVTGSFADTTYTYVVQIKNGVTGLNIEAPIVISGSTSNIIGAPFEVTAGSTFRDDISLRLNSAELSVTQGGWMGVTIVPQHPSGTNYPTCNILYFGAASGSTERMRFIVSSSTDRPIFIYDATSAGAANSVGLPIEEFQQGVPLGMVITWGKRSGTMSYGFFVNGKQVGLLTSAPIAVPAISGNGTFEIGNQTEALHGNVYIHAAALGNKQLPRIAARHLSSWFRRQALDCIGVEGS